MPRRYAVLLLAAGASAGTVRYTYTDKWNSTDPYVKYCYTSIIQWTSPSYWDPAPPTAEDTAVFGDWSQYCVFQQYVPVDEMFFTSSTLEDSMRLIGSDAVVVAALELENVTFRMKSGSIVAPGGVTLKNATLQIGEYDVSNEMYDHDAGTINADVLKADPAAAAKGFHSCHDLPTGFQPRVCGAGPITVDATSVVVVQGLHSSLFAPVEIASGGVLVMKHGSFAWKSVTNNGLVNIPHDTIFLGQLRNEVGGIVTLGTGATFTFDQWVQNIGNDTLPPIPEVTTVINAGTMMIGQNAYLQGTTACYVFCTDPADSGPCAYPNTTYLRATYEGTLENTPTGHLLTSDGTPIGPSQPAISHFTIVKFKLANSGTVDLTRAVLHGDVTNDGTLNLTRGVVKAGVRNRGRMSIVDGEVAASGSVANHAGARVALHRAVVHGALDNEGEVRVTGTNGNVWGGPVVNAGGVIGVDRGDVFVSRLRSDGGVIDLRRGAQINYQSTGGGDYCWESVSKYCGGSCGPGTTGGCDGSCVDRCRCCHPQGEADGAALLAAIPPLTSRFARNTTFPGREPTHPAPAAGAAAEEYAFAATALRGDGTGSAVFAGELRLRGDAALHVSGARVFTVSEHGAPAVAGGGELVVGDGGEVHLGIDAALGGGGRVAVRRGGLLGVDPHARVAFGNHSVHVAPGGRLHVDGRASFAPGAALRVCGARSGAGALDGADAVC